MTGRAKAWPSPLPKKKDINMKLTLSLADTAMALSAQPAWAGLTADNPPGSANKVIAVDAASNRITARLYVSSRKEPMIWVGEQIALELCWTPSSFPAAKAISWQSCRERTRLTCERHTGRH